MMKLLVANRGEIAVRVLQGAAQLGYRTVAVYSDADADARHVRVADEAVRIGPPAASDSYLSIPAIIEAARATGADAVHPGYGFLAENADFARAVETAGLIFVGPQPEAIDLMGNKRAAKERMEAAGVPCIPGFKGSDDVDQLAAKAGEIGLPVMIKAAAGGGGRGMRLVDEAAGLAEAIKSARSEAQSAFGNDEIIIEKAVTGARHVEIQVLADTHGHVIHLGERDCSVQRRHQKIVEESPCPVATPELRAAMGEAAVAAAKAIDYRGAGTVEFLLDADCKFYFLEMNTRLQVEHPVTELVTGVDLVAWQLRVASGEHLTLTQDDIRLRGHAIEVRLCAEEPANQFLPQTGPILAWQPPAGEGIRVDHGVLDGGEVSPHYDSMQAKIIAFGETRDIARQRLLRALDDTIFFGVACNRDFLRLTLAHPAFADGGFDTGFVPAHFPDVAAALPDTDTRHAALAAALCFHGDLHRLAGERRLSEELLTWHSANPSPAPLVLRAGQAQDKIRLWVHARGPGQYRVTTGHGEQFVDHEIALDDLADRHLRCRIDGADHRARFTLCDHALWLDLLGLTVAYHDVTLAAAETRGDVQGSGEIIANSDGKIIEVRVAAGDRVEHGQTLLVLEAMKMEFQVAADVDGEIAEVAVAAGDQVGARQLLVRITPNDAEG
ncbi:MAG: acetyl-CoA carboxylase biotin carboxylase subunit [Salinisphaeraceae bacterium]